MAKIVVVDDNDMMRHILCDFLIGAGHDAVGCANPATAVSLILSHKPDLAVLDYQMSGMTGAELLAELRTQEETRRLPVVFLSGTDTLRFAPEVPSETFIRFMSKPPDFERLQGLIADLLSSDGPTAASA
jgi:CheY-like chemotaxis protein